MKIEWLENANNDLIQIYLYIYKDSSYFASKTINEIINSINILLLFPKAGRLVQEFPEKDLRELIYKSYRIIYEIKSNRIVIHRIWHSARLLSKDIIS